MSKVDKETKKEFKKTDLGKKIFTYYMIALIFFIIVVIIDFALYHCIDVDDDVVINFRWFVVIIGVLAGYFEGHYVGALKQFALNKNKK